MSQQATSDYFARMKRKYQWLRGTEVLLWSVAIGLLTFYLCKLLAFEPILAKGIALILISISVFIGSSLVRLFSISEKDLAMYLNRRYPNLQESVDLLVTKDEDLSGLELLQKERTAQRFETIYPTV